MMPVMIGRIVLYHHERGRTSSLALIQRVDEDQVCDLVIYHHNRFIFLDHIEHGAGPNQWSLRQGEHRGNGNATPRSHVHAVRATVQYAPRVGP